MTQVVKVAASALLAATAFHLEWKGNELEIVLCLAPSIALLYAAQPEPTSTEGGS